jgi:hypothetical protein
MTALTDLRGPLYIDISKRKKGVGKPDSGLDWRGYNAAPHDGPDKGPDGRWKSGHPSIRALGEMPDFAHHFDDVDLIEARKQAQSLLHAIEREEQRRNKVEGELYETSEGPRRFANSEEVFAWMREYGRDKPAVRGANRVHGKPIEVKPKPAAKPIDPALLAKLEAINKRPLPRDRAELETALKGLTVAQLSTLEGGQGKHASKAQKIQSVIDRHLSQLRGEAVTHGPGVSGADAYAEFKRRKALADQRGDRDEYAALIAAYGIGGVGRGGLPPEKNEVPATPAKPETATQMRERALDMLSIVPEDEGEARRVRLEAAALAERADRMEAGAKAQARAKKPLKATPRKGKPDPSEVMAEIDTLVANPKTEADRERVKTLLGGLTLPQIKQVADKHNSGLVVGGNKAEKVKRLADSIVGTKLDSAGIAGGIASGAHSTRVAALRGATDRDVARGWLTGLSSADLKAVADDLGMPRGAARPARKADLAEAIVEYTAGNRANSAAIREGAMSGPGERNGFDVGAPKPSGPTYLVTPRTIQGDGMFWEGSFHPDGTMGTAWQRLSARQASENIDGQRLDDALAEAIRMGYSGEPGVWAKQKARFEKIISQVKDPQVKARLEYALKSLKPQAPHALSGKELADAPEPLRKLMSILETVPDTGQGGGEVARLADIMRRWSAGEISPLRLSEEIRRLSGSRHESQEGHHVVRRAVQDATKELEVLRRTLKRPGSESGPKA